MRASLIKVEHSERKMSLPVTRKQSEHSCFFQRDNGTTGKLSGLFSTLHLHSKSLSLSVKQGSCIVPMLKTIGLNRFEAELAALEADDLAIRPSQMLIMFVIMTHLFL